MELVALLDAEGGEGLEVRGVDDVGDELCPGLQVTPYTRVELIAVPGRLFAEQAAPPS